MRFPFFRFRGRSQPLRLKIPELIETLFAVYFTPPHGAAPDAAELKMHARLWLERYAPEPAGPMLCDWLDRGLVAFLVWSKDKYPHPPLDFIRHFGGGGDEEERYERATHVVMVLSRYNLALCACGLWGGLGCARGLAEALEGVVFDPLYPRFLPPESYTEEVPPDVPLVVSKHIAVPFSVDQRGLGWMTTTGMAKFGLPNLELADVPPDLPDGLVPIINAVAQSLVDQGIAEAHRNHGDLSELRIGPELKIGMGHIARAFGSEPPEPEEGVRGWTWVRLRPHRPRIGGERFLQLVPPAHFPAGQGEWLHSVLGDLLKTQHDVRTLPADSRAMRRAHARAVAEIPRIKARFQAGLRAGETLHVKHGFPTTGGGHEYMWVVVNSWLGERIRGQLTSEPQIRVDLRAGQPIELHDAEVFDWLLSSLDGGLEGGYTNLAASSDGQEPRDAEEP